MGNSPPDSGNRLVLMRLAGLIAVVLAVHFGLRLAYAESVEPDDADLILFSQHLAWGYSDQPPLYSWLCEIVFAVFGVGVVALTVMRTVVLAAGCALLYLNARLLCRDHRLALLGAYAVLLIPNLSWHALAYLTHTNLLLVACLAALYTFLRLARFGRTRDYLLFGVACAAGVLSKYNFVWFAAALLAAGLTVAPIRRRLLDPRMILAVGVGALLVLPHALWVLENRATLAEVLRIKTQRGEGVEVGYLPRVLRGTRDALVSGLLMAGPLALVVALFFRRGPGSPDPDPDREAARRMLGRFFLIVIGLVLLQIYALGVSRFHERWLQPFAVVFPLWLFARIDPAAVSPGRARAFAHLLVVFLVGYTAARVVQVIWFVDVPRGLYPMRMSFDPLARRLAEELGEHPTVITPEREVGGNLLLAMPGARVSCTAAPLYPVPLGDGPVVIAWNPQVTLGHLVPPWLLLKRFEGEPWYLQPIPSESVRLVEIAPAVGDRPPTVVAYVVVRR